MRLKLYICSQFSREAAVAVSRSSNQVAVEWLPFSAAEGQSYARSFQARLAALPLGQFQAVLYAGCQCATQLAGVQARHVPLVVPRQLNCARPGDCCRHDHRLPKAPGLRDQLEWSRLMATLTAAADARPLTPCRCRQDPERSEHEAIMEAAWFGWDFEHATVDLACLQALVDGYWSYQDYLVVPPSWQVCTAIQAGHEWAEAVLA